MMDAELPPSVGGLRKVLFVCLGNICRSPLAQAVFLSMVDTRDESWVVDSAGINGYHDGELADARARAVAHNHGLRITHRSRQIVESDFSDFDLIVCMDMANRRALQRIRPAGATARVALLRLWDSSDDSREVPDPYYGTERDFEDVYAMCERSCQSLYNALLEEPSHGE